MIKKSLLIKLHLYAGIFTAFYLMAFGFSALIMNHKVNLDHTDFTKEWESNVNIDSAQTNLEIAEHIRDQLNIMGWLPRWEFIRENEKFNFTVVHLGRKYFLTADLTSGSIIVKEAPKGILAVFHGLHFLNGKIPNAPLLIRSWAIYQWLSLFVMGISIVLGLWLWVRYSYRPWQGFVFGGVFIFAILIMILI